MDFAPENLDRFFTAVDAMLNGEIAGEDREELGHLLRRDAKARELYMAYVAMHGLLRNMYVDTPIKADEQRNLSYGKAISQVLTAVGSVTSFLGHSALFSAPAVAVLLLCAVTMSGVCSAPCEGDMYFAQRTFPAVVGDEPFVTRVKMLTPVMGTENRVRGKRTIIVINEVTDSETVWTAFRSAMSAKSGITGVLS